MPARSATFQITHHAFIAFLAATFARALQTRGCERSVLRAEEEEGTLELGLVYNVNSRYNIEPLARSLAGSSLARSHARWLGRRRQTAPFNLLPVAS